MSLLDYSSFYLVGIKGVAMTSMAQILTDAGKKVAGSDAAEEFVTQSLLDKLQVPIDTSFEAELPPDTDCVIYTAAHQADQNPQVLQAQKKGVAVISQAEAVAELCNQQQGIAVCGVGGKSTVSAMITWILEQLDFKPSFSIGVGNIPGLNKTGRWNPQARYFVIEADEYVVNPQAKFNGTPRFSFLKPALTICTNLKFDHPDVYRDFEHTQQVFNDFFKHSQQLIINYQDQQLVKKPHLTFGLNPEANLHLVAFQTQGGQTNSRFKYQAQDYQLTLHIPGQYNVLNALAAILAVIQLGIDPQSAADTLVSFRSTQRRFELIGHKNGVTYYDDYAHHPHEIEAVISTLNEWYPQTRRVVAFQSHTYSRTKELFAEFVHSFAQAQEVVMIDIFSSAREKKDSSVSSTKLCQVINSQHQIPAQNLGGVEQLAAYCRTQLLPGDVLITLGAGDIYQVHELI